MSQILFQGNNLVVTGEIGGEYSNQPSENWVDPTTLRRTLYLNFIVQMNGKMMVHKEALCLMVHPQLELEEWNTWYAICNIFSSFGYNFSEDRVSIPFNSTGIIKEWIWKLIAKEKETDPIV